MSSQFQIPPLDVRRPDINEVGAACLTIAFPALNRLNLDRRVAESPQGMEKIYGVLVWDIPSA